MFEEAFYEISLGYPSSLVEASRYLRSDATAHHFRGISTGYANAKARFRHRRQISYISMTYAVWCARRAVASAAISMTCQNGQRNKVRFQRISAFQGGRPGLATLAAPLSWRHRLPY